MESELTGWNMRMRTSYHFILFKPFWTQWTKKAQWYHTLLRIKNVIYYAFKLESENGQKKHQVKYTVIYI